jgi:hypothetical protein
MKSSKGVTMKEKKIRTAMIGCGYLAFSLVCYYFVPLLSVFASFTPTVEQINKMNSAFW